MAELAMKSDLLVDSAADINSYVSITDALGNPDYALKLEGLKNPKVQHQVQYFQSNQTIANIFSTIPVTAEVIIEPNSVDIIHRFVLNVQITTTAATRFLPMEFWVNSYFLSDETNSSNYETIDSVSWWVRQTMVKRHNEFAATGQTSLTNSNFANPTYGTLSADTPANTTLDLYIEVPCFMTQAPLVLAALAHKLKFTFYCRQQSQCLDLVTQPAGAFTVSQFRLIAEGIKMDADLKTKIVAEFKRIPHIHRISLARAGALPLGVNIPAAGTFLQNITTGSLNNINGKVGALLLGVRQSTPLGTAQYTFGRLDNIQLKSSGGSIFNGITYREKHIVSDYMAHSFYSIFPNQILLNNFANNLELIAMPISEEQTLNDFISQGVRGGFYPMDSKNTVTFDATSPTTGALGTNCELYTLGFVQGAFVILPNGTWTVYIQNVDGYLASVST